MHSAIRTDLIRVGLLAVVVALLWCAIYDRWTGGSWQTPVTYLGDSERRDVVSLFAGIKAASQGHVCIFIFNNVPELGAPHTANWDDYPMTEKPLIIMTGLLARIIGVFAAANFALLLAQVLAAVSFYAAARLLGGEWLWSFVAAIVFAFARYAFAEGLDHLTVTYYWHVPLCIVVSVWTMRGENVEFGTRRFWLSSLVALITGMQNIYYTNMFVQLVLLGGLLQGWRRGWRATLPAASIAATAAGALLIMNSNTFIHSFFDGSNDEAVIRNYKWLEIYGLKLVDLVVPPPDHPFPPFANWGAAYLKEIILSPGEGPPSAYLGVVGLSAIAWLVIDSGRRVANYKKLPLEAWLVLWIILYAEVGGLNSVAGALGIQFFRTATRYSIFLLALALIYAVRRLSSVARKNKVWTYGAAVLLCILALWDQTPPLVSAADLKETAQAVASDREFTEKMEKKLPTQAMVFQIPVMYFPESPVSGVGAYDHFRPYLYSHYLRFSFGSDKGRPQERWQHNLDKLSMSEAVSRLESYGFSALYVNLNRYTDNGAALIEALKGIGRGDMFTNDRGDLLCVMLDPAAKPVSPDGY